MKIDLPYIRIPQMNDLLKKLSPSLIEKQDFDAKELSKAFGVKRGTTANVLATLRSLVMAEGRGKYKFTNNGKKYVQYLIRKDEKQSRKILSSIVEDFEYVTEIRQWLNSKGKLSIEEIGNQIALKYEQKWENPLTVKTYGAAISSILDYLGEATYRSGTLFLKKAEHPTDSIPIPDTNVKKIVSIMSVLFPDGKDIHELSSKLKTSEGRLSSEILCCMELGFVERAARGFYKPTEIGKNFISPIFTDQNKKELFRDSLLSSRYREILGEIKAEEFTSQEMGKFLKHILRREWKQQTAKVFGGKFIGWLVYADIVGKEGKKYRFVDNVLKTKPQEQPEDPIKAEQSSQFKSVNPVSYYMLGKSIGLIQNPDVSKESVNEAISTIIAFCRENHQLKNVLESWNEDYTLYKDLKDLRIFQRDIKALEKVLGVKL